MALDSNDVFPIYRGVQTEPTVRHLSALLLAMGAGPNDGTVTFTGSQGITYPST